MEDLKQFILDNKSWLKQSWISDQIGCSPILFSNWMNGKRALPAKYEDKLRDVLESKGYQPQIVEARD